MVRRESRRVNAHRIRCRKNSAIRCLIPPQVQVRAENVVYNIFFFSKTVDKTRHCQATNPTPPLVNLSVSNVSHALTRIISGGDNASVQNIIILMILLYCRCRRRPSDCFFFSVPCRRRFRTVIIAYKPQPRTRYRTVGTAEIARVPDRSACFFHRRPVPRTIQYCTHMRP